MSRSVSPKPGLISVIVSTYNRPDALAVSLESFRGQIDGNFEILVADDGSDRRTHDVVAAMQGSTAIPIRHVRHEDRGFRLARIRNLAIRHCHGDYLILVDGDCFVLPDFTARHRALAESGKFVSGKRSYLRRGMTQRVLRRGRAPWGGRPVWLLRSLANQCTRPLEFLTRPDGPWRDRKATEWQRAQTCNMGVWLEDFRRVNGFDNRFIGHGLEDSDFVLRLIRGGTRRKLGDRACLVLHLEHERPTRPGDSPNAALFQRIMAASSYRVADGLDEAISEAGISVS